MLHYPLGLSYRPGVRPQVRVTDAAGQLIARVQRKAFQFRADLTVFADEARQRPLYRLRADRILDDDATYAITRTDGTAVGSVQRRYSGLWKVISYRIGDAGGREVGRIQREVKVAEALAGTAPVGQMLAGLFVNPAYLVDLRGATALHLARQPVVAPPGRMTIVREWTYVLERRGHLSDGDEALALPSIMMVLLLDQGSKSSD